MYWMGSCRNRKISGFCRLGNGRVLHVNILVISGHGCQVVYYASLLQDIILVFNMIVIPLSFYVSDPRIIIIFNIYRHPGAHITLKRI